MPDKPRSADEQQLARYLLGLVSEHEAERLDEATIVDDEFAARLRVAENDLVDDYARGVLSGEMLERFESRYLASPRRRQNVTFSKKFVGAVDRTARPEADQSEDAASSSASEGDEVAAPATPSGRVRSLALWPTLMAIAAVLLVACGALLFQALHLRSDLQVAQKASRDSDERAHALERQLRDERSANAKAAGQPTPVREAPSARVRPQALTTALVLLPQTRAAGAIPTVAVASGADSVAFELVLESNDYARYQVALMDPASNETVWRSGQPAAASRGDTPSIAVAIPARLLKPQHYAVVVTARSAATNAAIVGSYAFQVERR